MYKYAKEKLKRIPLDVPKEKYEQIAAAAAAKGEKVNGYIKTAIEERMKRESQADIKQEDIPDPKKEGE